MWECIKLHVTSVAVKSVRLTLRRSHIFGIENDQNENGFFLPAIIGTNP